MSNVEIFDTTFAMTILVILALCIPTVLLLANWFLHPGKIKNVLIKGSAYECGLAHVSGTANERYPVKYYLVAMLFLVFDLEVAFLYPWTVQFLAGGWELLLVLLGFLFILEAGYLYLYKKGVLDWTLVFRMCKEYGIHVPMTLENCGPADAPAALAYLSACQR